jgi:transcriptional regulator with XRE-family HTH domain
MTLALVSGGLAPLHERLRAMRERKGLSQPALFRIAEGVSFDAIRQVESAPGTTKHRYPTRQTLEAMAAALEATHEELPELRLARLRDALDERTVGLDAALELLDRIEAALAEDEFNEPREAVLPGPPAGGVLEELLEVGDELLAEEHDPSDETPDPPATRPAARRRRSA